MSEIYLGILSGTSMDAIDVACVDFSIFPLKLLGTHSSPYPQPLRHELQKLCQPGEDEINRYGQIDRKLGTLFAQACNDLLQKLNLSPHEVQAIGSHGQTIRHQPHDEHPFTLQIGDPNLITQLTRITTVADFRRRDMACGGQGAPLTPAFHQYAFHCPNRPKVIVNIGGISNVTFLHTDPDSPVIGFDCGPGNILLDQWIFEHRQLPYDHEGDWSKSGVSNPILLNTLLEDAYFKQPFPKSTGPEYFNINWLKKYIGNEEITPEDVQATLIELTACCIIEAIDSYNLEECDILLCGGGVSNKALLTKLNDKKGNHQLFTTEDFGIHPKWVEAIAFAWLARQTLNRRSGNIREVTGASSNAVLGGVYYNT